jgi:NADPH-dependent 7-cyano-7-deazaguanine reductase QueF
MKLPLSRSDLQNLKLTLDRERMTNEIVEQLTTQVTNDVIELASTNNIRRQYCRDNWNSIEVTSDMQERICYKLRENFPDCGVYFLNRCFLTLIVDWS